MWCFERFVFTCRFIILKFNTFVLELTRDIHGKKKHFEIVQKQM